MTELQPELLALDVSGKVYLPIIGEACTAAAWKLLPYDYEGFANDDFIDSSPSAVATVLHPTSEMTRAFAGRHLLHLAAADKVPYAIIASEWMPQTLDIVGISTGSPNLFIPIKSGEIVASLTSWLGGLGVES